MDYTPDEKLSAFLENGDRPIFVAFGRAASPDLALLQQRMIKALEQTGIRAIVQADQVNTADNQAENIFFIGSVPYPWIFTKVKAVVHHGGNSTNGLGLRAGLPSLVLPLALDQYFYGRCDHELGCGPAPIYIRKTIPEVSELSASLKDLISGRYDDNSIKIGKKLKQENGCLAAAETIEQWHDNLS